jgi:hypothetical protein
MSLFIAQLGAMAKLKRTAGQQKMTVEHVHVHAGGRAIVGPVPGRKESPEETRRDESEYEVTTAESTPEKQRGWLRSGNAPGDLSTAARCEAKTRRGTTCQCRCARAHRMRRPKGRSAAAELITAVFAPILMMTASLSEPGGILSISAAALAGTSGYDRDNLVIDTGI